MKNAIRNNKIIVFTLCFSIVAFLLILIANVLLESQVRTAGGMPEACNGITLTNYYDSSNTFLEGGILSRRIVSACSGKEAEPISNGVPVLKMAINGKASSVEAVIIKDPSTKRLYTQCPDGSFRIVNVSLLKKLFSKEELKDVFESVIPQPILIDGIKLDPSSYEIHTETLFDSTDLSKQMDLNSEETVIHINEKRIPEIKSLSENALLEVVHDEKTVYSGTGGNFTSDSFLFDGNGVYSLHIEIKSDSGIITYDAQLEYSYAPEFYISSTEQDQGGVFIIQIKNTKGASIKAYSSFDYEAKFIEKDNSAWCYIPVDHTISSGSYSVTVSCGEYSQDWSVSIKSVDFGIKYLSIKDEDDNEAQIDIANAEVNSVLSQTGSSFDSATYWKSNFISPVDGKVVVGYGTYLYINDSESVVRHDGIDYSSTKGASVIAPADGKVIYVGELESTGKIVIIEHGNGLHSCIYHMSSVTCEKGSLVKQGDEIGTVGMTKYTQEYGIHYQLMIGNACINVEKAINGTSDFYKLDSLGLAER